MAKLVALHTNNQTVYWDAHTVQVLISLCKKLNYDPPGVLRWLPATQREGHSCLGLLHRARRCIATDARDEVFALYGFLHLCFQGALPVNYAMDTKEVFSKIATYIVSTTRRLHVLKHVPPHQPLGLDKMASWIPGWGLRDFIDMDLPHFTSLQIENFAAFVSRPVSMEASLNTGIQSGIIYATQIAHQTELGSQDDSLLWYRYQVKKRSTHTDVIEYDNFSTWYPYPKHKQHRPAYIETDVENLSGIPFLRVQGYLLDKIIMHTFTVPLFDNDSWIARQQQSGPKGTSFLNPRLCRFCSEDLGPASYDGVSSD